MRLKRRAADKGVRPHAGDVFAIPSSQVRPKIAAKAPDQVGLTYPQAEIELERAGLLLGGVEEAPSETVPAGVIVAQDPAPGTELGPDSYVRLTTSVGPPGETTYGF